MSSIVCNSGPLIALGILGKLEILRSLFHQVLVPDAVQTEILQGGLKSFGLQEFQQALWIRVTAPSQTDKLLIASVDLGEAAVISVAREQNIKLVLIDERKARKVARDVYGLQPIGTARILVEAKKTSLLPEIAPLLQQLREGGYWLHEDIVHAALREAGEIQS